MTGEYLVLGGAHALVLPLKFGQKLIIQEDQDKNGKRLLWTSTYQNSSWFEAEFDFQSMHIIHSSNEISANYILKILKGIHSIQPEHFEKYSCLMIQADLGFNPQWGFGSSSTLISNLAQWARIDPLKLSQLVSKGSGFDIAAAAQKGPFIYHKSITDYKIQQVEFNPPFADKILFVYLGNKQNTEQEVFKFLSLIKPNQSLIQQISSITKEIVNTKDQGEFETLIQEHERYLSEYLIRRPVKDLLFPDFDGTAKSLGAWGGDFVMMTSKRGGDYMHTYLNKRNYATILQFDEIVLQASQGIEIVL